MTKKINNSNTSIESYEVGFKKPPKETRFVKGHSGNPHGRPKGKKNMATIIMAAANEMVTIQENGRTRQVTKFEAICKQTHNKAIAGDIGAIRLIMQLMPAAEAQLSREGTTVLSDERDRQVLAQVLKRFKEGDDA